jgi:tRNA(fMet)-specific endonuclease VapC
VYLLDTNVVSNFLDKRRQYPALRERILREPNAHLWISVVTLEEILRGQLPAIHSARNTPRVVQEYALLESLITDLMQFNRLPYDAAADQTFRQIPAAVSQHHPNDCRIAATAISRGFAVVTANLRHYSLIPDVKLADWTVSTS